MWQQLGVVSDAFVSRRDTRGEHRSNDRLYCVARRVDIEVHALRRFKQSVSGRFAFGAAAEPLAVKSEFIDPGLALIRLEFILLGDHAVRHRDFVLIQEIGERTKALSAVANDGRWHSIARTEAKLLQRRNHAVILRGVDVKRLPSEGAKNRLQLGHGKNHAGMKVELSVIAVDEHTQVVEMVLSRVHHRFPDGAFLQLAIACHAIGVEPRAAVAGDGKTLGDTKPLPHRTGGNVHAGQNGARMSIQNAGKRARVFERLAIEVAEFGINGGQRSNGMSLAQGENILPPARRIFDVQLNEATVEERDQRE